MSSDSMIERVSQILNAFQKTNAFRNVSDIARRANLPISTTHRLVAEMLKFGLLERDKTNQIRIGFRLWEISSLSASSQTLREAARPYLDDLHAVVQQNTQLGIMEGDEVVFIELLFTKGASVNVLKTASRLPVHACSSGIVLLGYDDPTHVEKIMQGPFRRYTDTTISNAEELKKSIDQAKYEGFAILRGAVHPAATGIAVPITVGPRAKKEVLGAIALNVPTDGPSPMNYVPALQATALGISRAMSGNRNSPHAH